MCCGFNYFGCGRGWNLGWLGGLGGYGGGYGYGGGCGCGGGWWRRRWHRRCC
ncbi:hypothetical protein [Methanosarcina sp. WWM596]|uniref:hypothetical protein n=1 Tax=Methanosarcina sp. WWM596 TaxID=1434103 RepID=UPI000A6F2CE8|nr:hypothetical protein [Methanosarcina sp. WWM596]